MADDSDESIVTVCDITDKEEYAKLHEAAATLEAMIVFNKLSPIESRFMNVWLAIRIKTGIWLPGLNSERMEEFLAGLSNRHKTDIAVGPENDNGPMLRLGDNIEQFLKSQGDQNYGMIAALVDCISLRAKMLDEALVKKDTEVILPGKVIVDGLKTFKVREGDIKNFSQMTDEEFRQLLEEAINKYDKVKCGMDLLKRDVDDETINEALLKDAADSVKDLRDNYFRFIIIEAVKPLKEA